MSVCSSAIRRLNRERTHGPATVATNRSCGHDQQRDYAQKTVAPMEAARLRRLETVGEIAVNRNGRRGDGRRPVVNDSRRRSSGNNRNTRASNSLSADSVLTTTKGRWSSSAWRTASTKVSSTTGDESVDEEVLASQSMLAS